MNVIFLVIAVMLLIAGCLYFEWSIERRYEDTPDDEYQCKLSRDWLDGEDKNKDNFKDGGEDV